jgi:adenylate cyclase
MPCGAPGNSREHTLSPTDVEALGGLSADETTELLRMLGLAAPAPDEQYLSAPEARALCELAALRHSWAPGVLKQLARVYGQAVAHVARSEVQLFGLHAESQEELRARIEPLLPVVEALLTGAHRRWLEHELAQAGVREAELQVTEGELPGTVEVALLFCDLKGFTAYAEAHGDAAAAAAIDRFAEVVEQEHGPEGRVVKALGDGYMLSYPIAATAVAAGVRMLERVGADHDSPPLHASVHAGSAVFRDGDYLGRAVNLAARLVDVAAADELLASDVVAEATRSEFEWKHVGLEPVRGFVEPVDVWRLVGARLPVSGRSG